MKGKLTITIEAVKAIKTAILQSRYIAARMANAEQLKLYFLVGGYVSANTRTGKWGTGAITEISRQLQKELPGLRGFAPSSMKYMRQFFETWTDEKTVQNLSSLIRQSPIGELQILSTFPLNHQLSTDDFQMSPSLIENRHLPSDDLSEGDAKCFMALGFTHHIQVFTSCKSVAERWYYINRCAAEFWSVETLKSHLRANDYKHEGKLPNNFSLTLPNQKQAARAVRSFKDEYLLDFINIQDADDEQDIDEPVLMKSLVQEIKKFIQALGADFCFIDIEHRLIVGEEEFFADLLFFHRSLKCLVAIELKRGKFKPAYLGQLDFYLAALDEQERKPDENRSIGLLLCQEANKPVVELAIRDYKKSMGVATYRTSNSIPKPYDSLVPLMDGVRKILKGGKK